ncbi:hypothetical protein HED51_22880 [Ochrobactrum grignonense]|nr:hypothetical protein [Brucella grignonensis]
MFVAGEGIFATRLLQLPPEAGLEKGVPIKVLVTGGNGRLGRAISLVGGPDVRGFRVQSWILPMSPRSEAFLNGCARML